MWCKFSILSHRHFLFEDFHFLLCSAEDRRDFLEAILREANADRAESMDVPDDDQLNELLSRT